MVSGQSLSSGTLRISLLFLFLFTISSLLSARQVAPPATFTHSSDPVEGTLHIVAVMVEFEPDTNRFTSGNGTFSPGSIPYLEDPGTPIDALPHNREFFEARLKFVKNYYEKVSGGLLQVDYNVLPQIYQLPNRMEFYSPIGENPELNPLAILAKDVWEEVSNSGSLAIQINPNDYVAFMIFHAGVGRDVELTGTILDRTPQDIPSVYLDRNAFRNLLNDPTFTGFEIDNGNVLVSNSLILPRTLTRSGEDVTGNRVILPLSVNGLITAQIGSFLGLPNLFNTNTGESGIGRFGLMDGAGIFAYNGLFPPEPSAWEKIYLGWAEPFSVSQNESNSVSLPAASLGDPNSIAKISLSSDEYFLLENRHRDPENEGLILTIQKPDGSTVNQQFDNSDRVFTNQQRGFDQLLEPGVVINVSNYDFALPGGREEENSQSQNSGQPRDLNGGILIWHIDEGVIRSKLGIEGINNDPNRRAVNLVEADGAQDIGRPVSIGISENPINGSPFDFWWSGNNATVITPTGSFTFYENRFGPDTTPDNSSNSGAASSFELYDFSENLPVASFQIREVNPFQNLYQRYDFRENIGLLTNTSVNDDYWNRYPLSMIGLSDQNLPYVLIPGSDGVQVYDIINRSFTTLQSTPLSIQQPLYLQDDDLIVLSENPLSVQNDIEVSLYNWSGATSSFQNSFNTEPNRGFLSTAQPSIIDLDRTPFRYNFLTDEPIELTDGTIFRSESSGQYQALIQNNNLILQFPGGTVTHSINSPDQFSRLHTGIIRHQDSLVDFYLLTDSELFLYSYDSNYEQEQRILRSEFIDWPAIADLNGDGFHDFILIDSEKNHLIALNRNGAFINGFPINAPSGVSFVGTPLIADIDGNDSSEIIITGQSDYSIDLYAFRVNGDKMEGFPLYVGGVANRDNQPIHPVLIDTYIAAVSHSGDFSVWEFENMTGIKWANRYGGSNNKVSGNIEITDAQPFASSLLNQDETYNWPNPAREETLLRFETSEPAEVKIKISTMSGRLIYDRTIQSRGGAPEEIIIDTSGWASGGYFAMVTATSGNKTEQKTVKIAVVK